MVIKSSNNISGGQKSRLAISRAIYQSTDAQVIVFDNVFSSLDVNIRHKVAENMKNKLLCHPKIKGKVFVFITNLPDIVSKLATTHKKLNQRPVRCLFFNHNFTVSETSPEQILNKLETKSTKQLDNSNSPELENPPKVTAKESKSQPNLLDNLRSHYKIDLKINPDKDPNKLQTLFRYARETYSVHYVVIFLVNVVIFGYVESQFVKNFSDFNNWPDE